MPIENKGMMMINAVSVSSVPRASADLSDSEALQLTDDELALVLGGDGEEPGVHEPKQEGFESHVGHLSDFTGAGVGAGAVAGFIGGGPAGATAGGAYGAAAGFVAGIGYEVWEHVVEPAAEYVDHAIDVLEGLASPTARRG